MDAGLLRVVADDLTGACDIAAALHATGKQAEHHTLETTYGHDSFLLEEARQTPIVRMPAS